MDGELDLWEGEDTYRSILTNDYDSSTRDIVEFYNKRGGKERICDDKMCIRDRHQSLSSSYHDDPLIHQWLVQRPHRVKNLQVKP